MNTEFWRGRRVLLTGHTGFKGSWLALWLQQLGAQLSGLALTPATQPNLFEAAGVAQGMDSRLGDVRDLAAVQAAVHQWQPELVIHMAAQALVRPSYADPVSTYATNVMGTVHVLEAARQLGSPPAVLVVTTDKCYENREWPWGYRESEPMGGHDPYSNSKGCAELVAASYRASFGLRVATARAGNVIGGGDWSPERLIPDVLAAWQRGEPVRLRNPAAIRPWQHVLEPLRGYLLLAEQVLQGRALEAWNFGPRDDDAQPVQAVVERLAAHWGEGAHWQRDEGQHPHEAHYLKLDISKARAGLAWAPKLSLDGALQRTADWARGHTQGIPARDLCLAQITQYESL
jgi:CDP-glucose 4,6-dehydratase